MPSIVGKSVYCMSDEAASKPKARGLDFLHDVTLGISAEFSRTQVTVRRLLELKRGSVMELDKLAGEPLDIRVSGKLVARGEAVIVNENFGIRITEIVSPEGEEPETLA